MYLHLENCQVICLNYNNYVVIKGDLGELVRDGSVGKVLVACVNHEHFSANLKMYNCYDFFTN